MVFAFAAQRCGGVKEMKSDIAMNWGFSRMN